MSAYRYSFFEPDGRLHATLLLYSSSDEEACELANDLLNRSECAQVELSRRGRLVYRIGRADAGERLIA
jgi:hypothetical protein